MPYNPPFHPIIQEFQQLIENNSEIREAVEGMFMAIPARPPYDTDPTGGPQIRNYITMLSAFSHNLTQAPAFYGDESGLPFDSILYWPRQTKCGQVFVSDGKINKVFKKMFDVWARFLTSRDSCHVLTTEEHGWFGPMVQSYALYYGFKSWDDFFTRRFRPGQRPVVCANDSAVINNACESTIYRIAYNVKERDMFWVKGSPYSLHHMLGGDPLAAQFAGGAVFQGYLSTTEYHRWHTIPGTYFANSRSDGFLGDKGYIPGEINQAYITAVATRMLIFIEADNAKIGLMCFMAIGMVEISTCEATIRVSQKVKKGQETGMFHFGGSSHCLIFREQTKISFSPNYAISYPHLILIYQPFSKLNMSSLFQITRTV
ncbi:Phophatidylserine decarboxylase-domain-containing protein [Cyathus striatus]|nr:Phophatidylserine decarboxylase-domain-containing protein [Cyathus striatus]